ncbi:MAG: acyl carrier protein [Polyangiales bacterium]
MESHRDKIREFIIENFFVTQPELLREDRSLVEQGIVDSTGVLELVAFLEKEFGISVGDDELLPENLDTIATMAAFVGRKLVQAA